MPEIEAKEHGFISAAWQKQPMLLGYSDVDDEDVSNTAVGTAGQGFNGSAVPAGEIWVLQSCMFYNQERAQLAHLEAQIHTGSSWHYLVEGTTGGAWRGVYWNGYFVMKEGGIVRCYYRSGHADGDTLIHRYSYFKIDIDK